MTPVCKVSSNTKPLYKSQALAGQHLICLQILGNGLVHDILGQSPVIVRVGLQPVAGKLFVEGRLSMTCFIAVCRPETGAVRCQHLVSDHDIAVLIQTKLKLGIRNDDTAAQCILSALFIQSDGAVTQLLCVFLSLARESLFQIIYTLLERNILIMITDLCFGRWCVDGLRQLVGFL